MAAIAVVALLALTGVSLAAAQGSEPKIPFTIAGNVIWADFWYDEMGGTRVPQLISIYHLKEGTFTEKKDGYQGGILLAETVTDADGNYSITLEADGMHLARVTIRVDGFPTQSAFAILADWHEGIPWERDIGWPGDWRPEDGNNHPGILKKAAQRAAARRTAPVQAIAEPADGTPGDPAEPQATAAGTVDEAFTSPQRVYLTASQGTLRPGNRGLMELAATNPAVNRRNLEVELTLEVPAGLQVSTLDGSYDPQTGRARYVILPAESKTVMLWVEAESPGQFAVAGRAEYGPEGGGQPRGAVELSHTFVVTEPPQTTEVAEAPQKEDAPEDIASDAQSQPEASTEEQTTAAAPQAQQEEPGGGSGGGCSIGDSGGPTDLSAVMFGGAMLTGLGMMLVRRRRG